jgi:hypothetical protein
MKISRDHIFKNKHMLCLNTPKHCCFHTTHWATLHMILEMSQAVWSIIQIFITVMRKVGKDRGL